jgi:hypothetical protein
MKRQFFVWKHYFRLRPKTATSPASTSAETMIAATVSPAAETGNPGEGVGVGGKVVAEGWGEEDGQGVMVGGTVGVEVGWVGVGVKAARMIIFWFG